MRRVVINGKQYAVGLDWFPLREQSKPEVIQEAEANYPDSNLVVMLKEQYGLGESGKSGVASWKRTSALAAALLPYTDAVHVFTLIDANTNKPFWWVFGVRKGLISAQSADFSDEMSANEYAAAMFDSLGVPESDAFDVQTSLALLSERLAAQKKSSGMPLDLCLFGKRHGTNLFVSLSGGYSLVLDGGVFPLFLNIERPKNLLNKPVLLCKTRKHGHKNSHPTQKNSSQANG